MAEMASLAFLYSDSPVYKWSNSLREVLSKRPGAWGWCLRRGRLLMEWDALDTRSSIVQENSMKHRSWDGHGALPFTEDCCIDRHGPDSAGHLCTLLEYCLSRQVFLFTDVSTTLPKTTHKKSWWCYYFIKCKRNQRLQDNKMKVSNLVFKSVLKN